MKNPPNDDAAGLAQTLLPRQGSDAQKTNTDFPNRLNQTDADSPWKYFSVEDSAHELQQAETTRQRPTHVLPTQQPSLPLLPIPRHLQSLRADEIFNELGSATAGGGSASWRQRHRDHLISPPDSFPSSQPCRRRRQPHCHCHRSMAARRSELHLSDESKSNLQNHQLRDGAEGEIDDIKRPVKSFDRHRASMKSADSSSWTDSSCSCTRRGVPCVSDQAGESGHSS